MAEWALVVLTFLTLGVLCKYAWDTRAIARASVAQLENAQIPFLTIAKRDPTKEEEAFRPGGFPLWVIVNQGFGPAINIRFSVYDALGGKTYHVQPSLATDDELRTAHYVIANAFDYERDFEITYESLSGHKYRTVAKMVKAVGAKIEFQRL